MRSCAFVSTRSNGRSGSDRPSAKRPTEVSEPRTARSATQILVGIQSRTPHRSPHFQIPPTSESRPPPSSLRPLSPIDARIAGSVLTSAASSHRQRPVDRRVSTRAKLRTTDHSPAAHGTDSPERTQHQVTRPQMVSRSSRAENTQRVLAPPTTISFGHTRPAHHR